MMMKLNIFKLFKRKKVYLCAYFYLYLLLKNVCIIIEIILDENTEKKYLIE